MGLCKCGNTFCYAKADLKAGKIKYPDRCHFCQKRQRKLKVGEVDKIGSIAEPEEKEFQGDEIEGKKEAKHKKRSMF